MRAFIDPYGSYYKAEVPHATTDLEKLVVNADFLDALPENGASVSPADLQVRIDTMLRVRRGDLTKAEVATQAALTKAKGE